MVILPATVYWYSIIPDFVLSLSSKTSGVLKRRPANKETIRLKCYTHFSNIIPLWQEWKGNYYTAEITRDLASSLTW